MSHLKAMNNRAIANMKGYSISPRLSANNSFIPSKNVLINSWFKWVKKQSPFNPNTKAIAIAIATRPAHITYMTAYRTAVMDLGVK